MIVHDGTMSFLIIYELNFIWKKFMSSIDFFPFNYNIY